MKALNQIHRYYYMGLVFLFFIFLYPMLWYAAKNKKRCYSLMAELRRCIASSSSVLSGFFFDGEEEIPIDWSRTYLICSNHSSNLDITALIKVCKQNFSFLGKEELKNNPVTGLFFKTIDIPVNRSSKVSSFRAFKKAEGQLMLGRSVVIFPEGGIFDDYPPYIHPFKNGAFKLAIDRNIPVLPIIIHDSWKLFWDDGKKYGTKPGRCHVSILAPIETRDTSLTVDELREKVYHLFLKSWDSKK